MQRYLATPSSEDVDPGIFVHNKSIRKDGIGLTRHSDSAQFDHTDIPLFHHPSQQYVEQIVLSQSHPISGCSHPDAHTASPISRPGALESNEDVPRFKTSLKNVQRTLFILGAPSDDDDDDDGEAISNAESGEANCLFSPTTSHQEGRQLFPYPRGLFSSMDSLRSPPSLLSSESRMSIDSRGSRRGRKKWRRASTLVTAPHPILSHASAMMDLHKSKSAVEQREGRECEAALTNVSDTPTDSKCRLK